MSKEISDLLVSKGKKLFTAPAVPVQFTSEQGPDGLLNDLKKHPHAFVIACIMDRQITAERAWKIPHSIKERLGTFDIEDLGRLSLEEVTRLMSEPVSLHRYTEEMSRNFYEAVQKINSEYMGDASKIWKGKPSSAEVVYRFLQFRGVGPKIGTMAANILARDFKIQFSDYYSIDLSVDVHVKRVFTRLELVEPTDDVQATIYKARSLYPTFPGIFDFPAWEIGRNWCRPTNPDCENCYMFKLCPSVSGDA